VYVVCVLMLVLSWGFPATYNVAFLYAIVFRKSVYPFRCRVNPLCSVALSCVSTCYASSFYCRDNDAIG
jgi:tRNA(His) 5'-end guanylyltransferase